MKMNSCQKKRRTGRPILLFQTMDSVTSIFLLHRNPDRAVVILICLFTIYTIIPLSRCIPAKLIVRITRKPLFEDLRIQALQRLRDRSDAVKYRPVTSRELIDHHSFGDFASGILTGHKITELSLSDIVDADTVLSDAVLNDSLLIRICRSIPGINVCRILLADLVPELRDFLISGIVVKYLLKTDN